MATLVVLWAASAITAFGEKEGIDDGLNDAAGQDSLAERAGRELDRICTKLSKGVVDNFIAQADSKESYFQHGKQARSFSRSSFYHTKCLMLPVKKATGLTGPQRKSNIQVSLPPAYLIGDSIVR